MIMRPFCRRSKALEMKEGMISAGKETLLSAQATPCLLPADCINLSCPTAAFTFSLDCTSELSCPEAWPAGTLHCSNMQETGRHVPERKISLALSMGSAALYGTVAIAMGFANKAALQIFGLANTLLLLQMCMLIIVVGALRVSKKPRLSQVTVGRNHEVQGWLTTTRLEALKQNQAIFLSL